MAELGTVTCRHVVDSGESVEFVGCDKNGLWQYLCGRDHTGLSVDDFEIVGVDHLEARQPELVRFRSLKPGLCVERIDGKWTLMRLEP